MERGLSIETQQIPVDEGHILEVLLKGELCLANCGNFEKALLEQLEENPKGLLIDMSGIEYVDSAGLGKLVVLSIKASKRELGLAFFAVKPRVQGLLQSAHLNDLLRILRTRDEALDSLQPKDT